MHYNTSKSGLKFKEYGRYVQELIDKAKTIEDKTERQAWVERIIDLMETLSPASSNPEEARLKMWSHLIHMAGGELDVDKPEGIIIHEIGVRAGYLDYPKKSNKMRQYGQTVKVMIEKAKTMEPEKRQEYVQAIGAYMKMAYLNWHKDHVMDETIHLDMKTLSEGTLSLTPGSNIDRLVNPQHFSKETKLIEKAILESNSKKKNKKRKKVVSNLIIGKRY